MPNIVKITTILNPLNLLAPHSCRGCGQLGDVLCNRCKKNMIKEHVNICPNCKNPNPNGRCPHCKDLPPTYVFDKRSELIGTLIHDLKYDSVRALSTPLAEIASEILPPIDGKTILVPLPTISRHVRSRGFDHTALITKKIAKLRHCQSINLLIRAENTVQVGSNRKKRLLQATKAYDINPHHIIDPDATYILFDDVWTTGASLRAAKQKLEAAGAQKFIFVILALSV